MKIYIQPKKSRNIITTIAIGGAYLEAWERNALPGWAEYCDRHGLGLIVIDTELINRNSEVWKKATWQKLLIAEAISQACVYTNNACYLDTDILISPLAPNVFDKYDEQTIGIVSQINGLPMPLDKTLRRLAFLRHTHWTKEYPLDSALFMSPKQIYKYHNLPAREEYFCAGFLLFNIENHKILMKKWFEKYSKDTDSITGGGDEPHLNHEILSWGRVSWMPYEFQALWIYEIAWKYPFLFDAIGKQDELVRECIEASLYSNHFLHFAGSWHECQMWKIGKFFQNERTKFNIERFKEYLQRPLTGEPKGIVRP
jgi:hypothetical protein